MNSGQTAAATFGGALLAESLVGGIGIGMLGTAFGIPAAAVVAAVGGTATALKLIQENNESKPIKGSDFKNYYLEKEGTLYQFCIRKTGDWGYYHVKAPNQPWSKKYYHFDMTKLRTAYAVCLRDGYVRIN